MPLFHIQDDDRQMWVIAHNYQNAASEYHRQMCVENEELMIDGWEPEPPKGIVWICDDDEILITNALFQGKGDGSFTCGPNKEGI